MKNITVARQRPRQSRRPRLGRAPRYIPLQYVQNFLESPSQHSLRVRLPPDRLGERQRKQE